jgi:peptidoglycan/xylan/chitin deacetylase (PgdA/CDA1 family)
MVLTVATVGALVVFANNSSAKEVNPCKCVAFRFDDVQDYYLRDVQIGVMEQFSKREAKLTLGIIGNYFGNDETLVTYVRKGVDARKFEAANHGWNHESFIEYQKEEQSRLMNQTNSKIFATLGARPLVFIAPYNTVNADTFAAARENNILYISANMTTDRPPYHLRDGLYHYPSAAITGDLNDDDTSWVGFGHQTTLAQIRQSVEDHGFVVVTMHPMEFAARNGLEYSNKIDVKQLAELDALISSLQGEEFEIVAIGELGRT